MKLQIVTISAAFLVPTVAHAALVTGTLKSQTKIIAVGGSVSYKCVYDLGNNVERTMYLGNECPSTMAFNT